MKPKTLFKYSSTSLALIISLFLLFWLADLAVNALSSPTQPSYGVTFSTFYSRQLGLDITETYQAIISDLKVKKIRLPVYWNEVEKTPGEFNFQLYDKLLDLAKDQGIKVILVIGYKVPRWPECFAPSWGKNWSKEQYQAQIRKLLETEVDHFQRRDSIVAWQVENEPLLNFGVCQMFDKQFLEEEVNLVRSKDPRPIILTDSGELGLWVTALQSSDIMGTSLYRTVYAPIFGFFRYPFPPLYYRLKATLTQIVFAPDSWGVFISELQAEPWSPQKHLSQTPIPNQIRLFSLKDLQRTVEFTTKTHIKEQLFWGVEWWYWMKTQGYPEYWDFAKKLF